MDYGGGRGSDRAVLLVFSGSIPEITRESWGEERAELRTENRGSFYLSFGLDGWPTNSTVRIMILAPHRETAEVLRMLLYGIEKVRD